jgi:peptidoglycan/LPS O-acetylase OafA/YrhL
MVASLGPAAVSGRQQHYSAYNLAVRHLFTPPPDNVRFLDGMRALAILGVVAFHSMIQMPEVAFEVRDTLLGRCVLRGGMGVDLFFVLSGYLIGGQLLRQGLREVGGSGIRFGEFYVKRFFRIFPAYYLVLVLLCAVVVHQPFYDTILRGTDPADALRGAWANALYLNNYTGSRLMPWGWSLAVEEHFYLIIPLLLAGVLLRLPPAMRTAALWVLFFLPWVSRYLTWQSLGIDPIPTGVMPGEHADRAADAVAWMDRVVTPSHNRMDALMVGVLCAHTQLVSSRARQRWTGWTGLGLTGLCGLVLWVYVAGKGGRPIGPGASAILLGPAALAFGGLLQRCLYHEGSWLRRALSVRAFYPVARVSYGMYLLHPFLIAWIGEWGPMQALREIPQPGLAVAAVIAVNAVVAYAFAAGMFAVWEWPMMRLRARVLDRLRTSRQAS